MDRFASAWIFLLVLASLSGSASLAADSCDYEEVVYLKNGSVIRGVIVEQRPGGSWKIETKDGNIVVFDSDEIDKITKERRLAEVVEQHRTTAMAVQGKSLSLGSPAKQGDYNYRNPGLAWFFSFLLPGGGQYYNGARLPSQHVKGALFTASAIVGSSMRIADYDCWWNCSVYYTGLSIWLASWVTSMIDAPIIAAKIRDGKFNDKLRKSRKLNFALSPQVHDRRIAGVDANQRIFAQSGVTLSLAW